MQFRFVLKADRVNTFNLTSTTMNSFILPQYILNWEFHS